MYKLPLAAGLTLSVDSKPVAPGGPDAVVIELQAADGTAVLPLEPNWSQAVFNNDFHSWLIALVAKINASLTKYLAEQQGPATQADLEAALSAKLTFDPATNQVVINH